MMRSLLLALALCAAAEVRAEPQETLAMMYDAVVARTEVREATVDGNDLSLKVVLQDGTELVFYPDNLDLQLKEIATEEEELAAVQDHIDAIFVEVPLNDLKITEHDLPRLLPMIGVEDLYADIAADVSEGAELLKQPWLPGFSVYIVVDEAESLSYLTSDDLERSTQSKEAIFARAMANLAEKAAMARVEDVSVDPWIGVVELDAVYEGSLLLMPGLWNELEKVHGRIGAVYPARGMLFVFEADDFPARTAIIGFLSDEMDEVPYPVSDQLFVWSEGAWDILRP